MNLRNILVPVVACLLAACASKGPEPSPLPDFKQSGQFKELWGHGLGSTEGSMLRPTLVGGSVYAASRSGELARYDATGRRLWRVWTDKNLSGGVGSDGTLVAVASSDGNLIVHDASTGKRVWSVPVGGEIVASPLVSADMVVVRIGDNVLAAYNVADGKRRWIYQRPQSPLTLRAYAGILQTNELVIAGFPGGKLVAVSAGGGVQRWEASIMQPKGSNELERMADVVGTPLLQGDSVCVVAYQGKVACVDRDSGGIRWTRDFSSATGIDADAKGVFVTDTTDVVYSLDMGTGSTNWKQDSLKYRKLGRPVIVGDAIVVSDAEGYVHVMSRQDGHFIARVRADSSGVLAPIQLLPNNSVALQSRDGDLYVYAVPQ